MKKNSTAFFIVVILVVGGYIAFSKPATTLAPTLTESAPAVAPTPAVTKEETPAQYVVTSTDSGYSPATLTIQAGETVVFKNESTQAVRTASAFHPTHTAYPTTGGCVGSTFDACRAVQPGESWSFTFDAVGSWAYHDHLHPGNTGTIVVE